MAVFEEALFGDKRRYPLPEFKAFWEAARRYAEFTKSDPLIHRCVAEVVHGLRDKRLESLVFDGYDPHFEGDEPPGL